MTKVLIIKIDLKYVCQKDDQIYNLAERPSQKLSSPAAPSGVHTNNAGFIHHF